MKKSWLTSLVSATLVASVGLTPVLNTVAAPATGEGALPDYFRLIDDCSDENPKETVCSTLTGTGTSPFGSACWTYQRTSGKENYQIFKMTKEYEFKGDEEAVVFWYGQESVDGTADIPEGTVIQPKFAIKFAPGSTTTYAGSIPDKRSIDVYGISTDDGSVRMKSLGGQTFTGSPSATSTWGMSSGWYVIPISILNNYQSLVEAGKVKIQLNFETGTGYLDSNGTFVKGYGNVRFFFDNFGFITDMDAFVADMKNGDEGEKEAGNGSTTLWRSSDIAYKFGLVNADESFSAPTAALDYSGAVNVTWSAVDGANGYTVNVYDASDRLVTSTEAVQPNVSISGLALKSSYRFQVVAESADGRKASNIGSYTLPETVPAEKLLSLTAPGNMTLTEDAANADAVLALLPKTAAVTTESGSPATVALSWVLKAGAEFNAAPEAENIFTWTADIGALDANGISVSGDITVTNRALSQFGVTYNLTNLTVSPQTETVNENADLTVTLETEEEYMLPSAVTVTMGGSALSDGQYSYDSESGELTVTGVKGNVVITASGIKKTYTVSVSEEIENGTVTADKAAAAKGDTVTVTVSPNTGYRLQEGSLKYDDTPLEGNSFVMPAENVTISAVFEALPAQVPVISGMDAQKALTEGDRLELTVTAAVTDGGSLSYQWYKDDAAIEGATEASYSINAVTADDAGNYKVVVTNTVNGNASTAQAVCDVTVTEKPAVGPEPEEPETPEQPDTPETPEKPDDTSSDAGTVSGSTETGVAGAALPAMLAVLAVGLLLVIRQKRAEK